MQNGPHEARAVLSLRYFQDRDLPSVFADTGRGALAAWERSSLFTTYYGSTIWLRFSSHTRMLTASASSFDR